MKTLILACPFCGEVRSWESNKELFDVQTQTCPKCDSRVEVHFSSGFVTLLEKGKEKDDQVFSPAPPLPPKSEDYDDNWAGYLGRIADSIERLTTATEKILEILSKPEIVEKQPK